MTKSILQPLSSIIPGAWVTYTLSYDNTGPDPMYNVILTDTPGTGLTISDASSPYTSIWTGRQYGVPGDSCYDAMATTSGYYVAALDQWAISQSQPDFYAILVLYVGYTGSTNR